MLLRIFDSYKSHTASLPRRRNRSSCSFSPWLGPLSFLTAVSLFIANVHRITCYHAKCRRNNLTVSHESFQNLSRYCKLVPWITFRKFHHWAWRKVPHDVTVPVANRELSERAGRSGCHAAAHPALAAERKRAHFLSFCAPFPMKWSRRKLEIGLVYYCIRHYKRPSSAPHMPAKWAQFCPTLSNLNKLHLACSGCQAEIGK
jgi:hypothetical protein